MVTHFLGVEERKTKEEKLKDSLPQNLEQDPTPINDRKMTMRLSLHNVYAAIISAYAPKMTNPAKVKEVV